MLGLAITQHRRAIVFRREYAQLKALVERSREIVGERGRFNGHDNTWRLDSGSMFEFGAVQYEHDVGKYRGRSHDLCGFDEATEFSEAQVRFLLGWLRTTTPGQRCRAVLTFNPPTSVEGRWVVRFFAPWIDRKHPHPAQPGELRWYAMVGGEEVERPDGQPFAVEGEPEPIKPLSRTFYPARLADNPRLMRTGYGRQLQSLPEPLRSQLLFGDFEAGVEDDPWQVIPTAWVELAMARWLVAAKAEMLTTLGVDVAHGGKDQTVIAPRYGAWFDRLLKFPGKATPDGHTAAAEVMKSWTDGAAINVDCVGVGASAYERIKQDHNVSQAVPVNFGGRSDRTDRSGRFKMANIRAEAYWRLREALDPENGDGLALPPDPELRADLTAGKYEITPSGIRIESKDDIIVRLGRSPDCFVAGTPVLTIQGDMPIEDVPLGMPVWTRDGWRRVIGAGMTDRDAATVSVLFSDGRTLRGSGNHPVFVREKGWTRMDSLVFANTIVVCNTETLSSSTGSRLFGSRRARAYRSAVTSTRLPGGEGSRESAPFIKRCGWPISARSPKGTRSTTKTKTRSTTILPTSNASPDPSMVCGTATRARRSDDISSGYVLLPQFGMVAPRVGHGTPSMGDRHGTDDGLSNGFALSVSSLTSPRGCVTRISFAQAPAASGGTIATRRISSRSHAPSAGPCSWKPRASWTPVAPVHVVCVVPAPAAPIFNLTVEGTHEYYANGILVHNCGDAVALAMLEPRTIKFY